MLGNFKADALALEPAAAELLGFVVGRMPALESLQLESSYRSMSFTVRRRAGWAACNASCAASRWRQWSTFTRPSAA